MKILETKEVQKRSITVGFLFERMQTKMKLRHLNESVGLEKEISDKNIHRPGLALAGYVELFTYNRVQVFGNTEIKYLNHLTLDQRINAFKILLQFDIPCIIVTNNNPIDEELVSLATKYNIAVMQSTIETTKFFYLLSDFLDDQFALQTVVHGSFIDVYGVGVLIMGKSGIGKSEVALDLVERGQRLVADDVVMITRKGEDILMGAGTDLVKHFMEIRGLGLIDVRSMFGVRAIRYQKRLEIVVELQVWEPHEDYTRTGLDEDTISIMDAEVPLVKLPIFPGKNVTVIIEVIALNHLLKHYGYDAAKEFTARLERLIDEKSRKNIGNRAVDFFEHDFE
jgi:HPr kinase/phosphorylase